MEMQTEIPALGHDPVMCPDARHHSVVPGARCQPWPGAAPLPTSWGSHPSQPHSGAWLPVGWPGLYGMAGSTPCMLWDGNVLLFSQAACSLGTQKH